MPPRLLADENVPGAAISALRDAGYDVTWIREVASGATDEAVLERAQVEQRVVVTFDKDFGELAHKHGASANAGVILFRITPSSPAHVAKVALDALGSRDDWTGIFAVVEDGRIRLRALAPLQD